MKEEKKMRKAVIKRETSETKISLNFVIDGQGKRKIKTSIPFFDHMLDLFTKQGQFDLTVTAKGDLDIDAHHTVEDVGICLGLAIKESLGDCKGIQRYASGLIPMDEALCQMAIDICNRPTLVINSDLPKTKVGEFDVELVEEFFNALVNNARISLHIDILRGNNIHHIVESIFKAFGVILDQASRVTGNTIPSTKGKL
tara:strand:- start:933 stop:1529 length:597 start_codon:yes stop_codon:yes gene_type:complete